MGSDGTFGREISWSPQESCGLVVKLKIFQTPPPPQDFLAVLWWILLIKWYKIYIFLQHFHINISRGESCGLVVKMKIFQPPPPPQDFLVVLWWILLIKWYKINIFLYHLKILSWILWSCCKKENIPTPTPTTRFSRGLVVNFINKMI